MKHSPAIPLSSWLPLVTLFGLIFFALHLFYWPSGVDYHDSFYPVIRGWQQGIQPYTSDLLFFNAPWTILILLPFTWLTERGGQAGLALFSLLVMGWGWQQFSRPLSGYIRPWLLAVCLFNLHTFDLLWRGQVDALTLLGLLLAYKAIRGKKPDLLGIGWTVAAAKPTSILIVLVYTVYLAYRGGYLFKALRIPLLTFLVSLLLFDVRWPFRFIDHLIHTKRQQEWVTTLWRAADYLHISSLWPALIALLILGVTFWTLRRHWHDPHPMVISFLTVTSVLITPYALSYHYSVLMVVFVPPLLVYNRWLLLPIFLLTLLPIVRVFYGVETAWIDLSLPMVIWGCHVYYLRKRGC